MISMDRRILAQHGRPSFNSSALVFAPGVASAQEATPRGRRIATTAAQGTAGGTDRARRSLSPTAALPRSSSPRSVVRRISRTFRSRSPPSPAGTRNRDIRDITRLEQTVPGLRIARSGAGRASRDPRRLYRAISANSDPRIGFYIDEIYQSRLQQTTAAFVDLERVEVQKGPQGTLFGRNSLGGNIALSSAAPRDQFDFGGGLIYGSYDRIKAEGFVNVPLADGLAFRVAGALDRHDPIYKSVVNSRASIGDLDYKFVRASLRFAPPGMDDRLEVDRPRVVLRSG
jgi:iron complex outermembrane receptor protein